MANFLGGAMRALSRSPKTAKFVDTLEALALAPIGAASLAGAAGGLLADAAMGLAPDLPEVPDEYYEAAQ